MKDITFDLPLVLLLFFAFMMLFPFVPVIFAQEGLGTSEKIDTGFDWLYDYFENMITGANVTGNEIPTNTTEDELLDLLDNSVKTGKSGKNFLFDFHHLIESAIDAVVPDQYELDPLLVLLISWGVGSFLVFMIFRHSLKHLLIFASIFGFVIILFMIGGINPEF